METRQNIEFTLETVELYESKILNKNTGATAQTITAESIDELQTRINVWIKCGNFEVKQIEKVNRQQVKIA